MTPAPSPMDFFKMGLRPSPDEPIWKWAEKEIYLSAKQATGFPGRYQSSLTPYVRGVLDALQDTAVNKVTVEKGAQTGLTLTAYVWVSWGIVNDPAPTLFMYPSEHLARSASETRFLPMIEECSPAKQEMPSDRDEYTKLQQRMRRCTINWIGANSPANIAMRPCRNIVEDETDKYPVNNQREAPPMALAEQRAKTFWNHTIFQISTPTTPDGAIHSEYLAGDQCRYFVPCHKCGAMQVLKWAQVKWPEGQPWLAKYECEICKAEWDDVQKNDAVAKGVWRATATPRFPWHKSFHVSSLYSPWTRFGNLATRFMQVKDYPNELQDFINSELGEPFERSVVKMRDGAIAEREGQYERGQIFVTADLYREQYANCDTATFLGVDVQKDCLVVVARAFAPNGASGLIEAKLLGGFKELNEYANALNAHSVMIDCGYRMQEVLEYSLQYRFIPTKGSTFRVPGIWEQTQRNIYEGTRRAREGITISILMFDPNQLKDQLYDRVNGTSPFSWLVYKGCALDESYCRQMASEARDDGGKWNPVRAGMANHFWDAEVLSLLGATVYGYNTHIIKEGENANNDDNRQNR